MNWQALNPLRLVGTTKAAFSAVGSHVTSKRLLVAAATGLVGTAGSGGYVYWKNSNQGTPSQTQVADANPAAAPDQEGGSPVTLSPIPDEENSSAPPTASFGAGLGRSTFVSTGDPNGDGTNSGNEVPDAGAAADASENGFRPANDLRPRPQAVGDETLRPLADAPVEGNPTEGAPTNGDPASDNAAAGAAGDRAEYGRPTDMRRAGEVVESPSAEAAVAIPPETEAPAPQPTENVVPAEQQELPRQGPVDREPAEPTRMEPPPPRDLVPVEPTQLQPPPPEEHVRLPEESSPNLVPGRTPNAASSNPPATPGSAEPAYRPGSLPRSVALPDAGFSNNVNPTPPSTIGGPSLGLPAGGAGEPAIAAIGQPGAKHLEGAQTPTLTLEKMAPEEIQVGQPATFVVKVRNTGRVVAHQVVVVDQVPQGTRLLDTAPAASRGADGSLRWQLGTLEPGQETTVSMQILPEQEGEVGSVAQVTFQSQASVRTVATRPQITVEHRAPQRVLIGQPIVIQLTITNSGSGAANGLVIEEAVPEGLGHPAGPELEYPIGTLRPNETRRVELTLKALKPGVYQNVLVARTENQTLAEDRIPVEVQAPQMVVGVTGPKVRYLDRPATYSVSVSNPGTAAATNVEIMAQLPRGLKFVSADHQGHYDPERHAVLWGLAELPSGVAGTSQLVVVPTEPGEQRLRVEGHGDLNLEHSIEQAVLVETLSELQFAVADAADPIEVGSETTYDVRIMNRGSRSASNIQVAIDFPPELEPLGGEGATRVTARGGQLTIEPLARLAPNAQVAYQIHVRGVRKGDPRIRVRLTSDESPNPVTKEESTRVYADE